MRFNLLRISPPQRSTHIFNRKTLIFYSYTYHLEQEIELAFNYFLNKEYLIKFFDQDEDQETYIESPGNKYFLTESEQFKIISEDKDSIFELIVDDIEIQEYEFIKMRMSFGHFEDKFADENDDDQDWQKFMDKYIGREMIYSIEFYPLGGNHLEIVESAEVHNIGWLSKIGWRIIGLIYQFRQTHLHKIVHEEIEAL